jgi:hypothetical protein
MAYPATHPSASPSGSAHGPAGSGTAPASSPVSATPRCPASSVRTSEGEHQLEKLEFALAVAMTRGDAARIQRLREQIAALGGNCEEPGT